MSHKPEAKVLSVENLKHVHGLAVQTGLRTGGQSDAQKT